MNFEKDSILEGQMILVNKPLNWTSFQVVNKVRWLLRKKHNLKKIKVGHAGTLDPLASGLLLICTGKMTKKIEDLMGKEKTYTGTFFVGATTPSYDLETKVDNHFAYDHITPDLIEEVKKQFVGTISQQPPLFSAIKKEGKRLYEHARAGEQVEIPNRDVVIHKFELTRVALPEIDFKICCSKGTYIRSIANDFGKALDSGAYLKSLCRTAIGPHSLEEAFSIETLETLIKS
jgi:tRNA pseudouridine55 synthase